MPATQKSQNYIPHIDGLRGLAVLLVLFFHLDIAVFKGGFIGVDIFFVISGFLITGIITREIQNNTFSFANFYARRIKRIFPALFFMLFCTCIGAIIFLGPEQYSYHFKSMRMAAAQISNVFFMQSLDYFDTSGKNPVLLHTWSLGVEEQFYLIWPFLLLGLSKIPNLKIGIPLGIICILSLGLSEYLLKIDAMQSFYMLHARAWELAIGGIIATNTLPQIKNKTHASLLGAIGLCLITFAALTLSKNNFPGFNALLPCLGAALIIYSGKSHLALTQNILSTKPIVFLGLISYSLYLWHWVFIAFYKEYFDTHPNLTAILTICALSVIIAALSYRYIEQPFRKSKASAPKAITIGVLIIIATIVGTNILKKHSKAPWRITAQMEENVTKPNQWVKTCSNEGGAYNKDCIIGPNKEKYEVIITGDSHASHFIPTVLDWAKTKGLTVRLFMRGACETWIQTKDIRKKDGKTDHYCHELTENLYKTLKQDTSIEYIFLALRTPKVTEEMETSLKHLKSFGKTTVFLGSVYEFKDNPNNCFVKNNLLATKLFPKETEQSQCLEFDRNFNESIFTAIDNDVLPLLNALNIAYFDPRKYMNQSTDINGNFMYMDDNHLNIYGAKHLTPHFINIMENMQ